MYAKGIIRIGSRRSPILSVEFFESRPTTIPHHALFRAASRVCPDAPAMARELALLQSRLGTRGQLAHDQDRINVIALQLSSLIYAAFLLEDQEREGGLTDDSAGC
jgi:hypothetical protein